MIIYVLFDKVSNQFTPTFEQPTRAAAVRALKKDPTIMATLDDFLIFRLGEKLSMDGIEETIPDGFNWNSVLRLSKELVPVSLKEFLGEQNEE